jgi:hypothetical protein
MEKGEQEFQLHLGLEVGKALLYVAQNLSTELRANRAARPRIVRRAEFVMKPQRSITVSDVRHY